ncbi:hypothetical protein ACFC0D_03175 [Streptomyces sp. NPDC056222]
MTESWVIEDGSAVLSSKAVRETLRARIGGGELDMWLTSSSAAGWPS